MNREPLRPEPAATDPGILRARTVAVAAAPDLIERAGEDGYLFRHEGGGLAGRGVALRIDLPEGLGDADATAAVSRTLAAIPTDDPLGRPGTGPVALGALPFDPAAGGHLVVPRLVYGYDRHGAWMTTVEVDGAPPAEALADPARPGQPPDVFNLTPSLPHSDWKAVVAEAVEMIGHGDLAKVVLARRIDIEANRDFVVTDVLERLSSLYPSTMVYSVEGFIGASPELLLRRSGVTVESHPLAGTVARSGDANGDETLVAGLMASPKTRHEHRVVVEQIGFALQPLCEELTVPETPSIMGLRNVSHLATHITGRLSPAAGPDLPSALELVARIHPTPAVGGWPTDAAVRYLQKVEGFDRGRYAGPVGWVDSRGDGCFALGIRCAEVDGPTARIYAGNGIVAGSDPADELAETQLKLQALLAALVRP